MAAAPRWVQSWALPLYWQWRSNSDFGFEDIAATAYSGLVLAVGCDGSVSSAGVGRACASHQRRLFWRQSRRGCTDNPPFVDRWWIWQLRWREKDIIHGSSNSVSIGGHGGFGFWFLSYGIDGVDRCGVRFGGSGDVDSAPSSAEVTAALVT